MKAESDSDQVKLYSKMENSISVRIKEIIWIIVPLDIGFVLQMLVPISNIAFAGIYLGKLSLAAVALSQSVGYLVMVSFLLGFSSANDTLGSQAFGAQDY